MIRKLIISAVVLTALIAGKEAHAAGPAGFARSLSTSAAQVEIAGLAAPAHKQDTFTAEQRNEATRLSASVEEAIAAVDTYFDTFADEETKAAAPVGCFDCADVKRGVFEARGWAAETMRIAYAVSAEGRIERVLVIDTALGELVVGRGRPVFTGDAPVVEAARVSAPISYYDI